VSTHASCVQVDLLLIDPLNQNMSSAKMARILSVLGTMNKSVDMITTKIHLINKVYLSNYY